MLKGKYDSGLWDADQIVSKNTCSSLWNNIVKLWLTLCECDFWVIGNGEVVDAWGSNWIEPGFRIAKIGVTISNIFKMLMLLIFWESSWFVEFG